MTLQSQVIITKQIDKTVTRLRKLATKGERFDLIAAEGQFKIEHAKLAIEKAYLASRERNIIILAGDSFSAVVQNKLLKILEEPPPNKEFILLFPNRATILHTIRSRLPVIILDEENGVRALGFDVERMDIRAVYDFVQEHARSDSAKIKIVLEQIGTAAIRSQRYNLDERTLNMLRDGIKALDRGSPPTFVLTGVLLKLLARKKK